MKPSPQNHFARVFLSAIAAPVALVFTASQTHAAATYTGTGDDWAEETNWTPNVVPDGPAGAFNQRLNFTGNTTVTFTTDQGKGQPTPVLSLFNTPTLWEAPLAEPPSQTPAAWNCKGASRPPRKP